MRKRTVRAVALLMALIAAISLFCSCEGFFTTEEEANTDGLIYDSKTELSIIIDPSLRGETVMLLWERIGELANISPRLSDNSAEMSEHEITIGRVGRPVSNKAYDELEKMECEDGELRYLIYSDGSSVAIAFDDDDYGYAMREAVGYFMENFVSERMVIAAGIAAKKSFAMLDESTASLGASFDGLKNGALPKRTPP